MQKTLSKKMKTMKTDMTEDEYRTHSLQLLKQQNWMGVVQHGHWGNYLFIGSWKPREDIIKTYKEMRCCEDQKAAEDFADSAVPGVIFSAIYEEFDDKFSPYIVLKGRSTLSDDDNTWKDIYNIISKLYFSHTACCKSAETYSRK